MKRAACAGIAMCATLAGAGSCKSKSVAPNTGSGTGSEGAPPDATGAGHAPRTPAAWNPTAALVRNAFGGNVPAFPLLARDGSAVAIGIESPFGRSEVATYSVAIFTGWTATADVWDSSAKPYPIVDATMATMLLDSVMGEAAPSPDPETLKIRAAAVTKRLTEPVAAVISIEQLRSLERAHSETLGDVIRTVHGMRVSELV